MNLTPEEIALLSDTEFFSTKARVSPKIRRLLERVHESFQHELKTHRLLVPEGFDPEASQYVKGEHLENFPYQYLDYPRFFTRDVKFTFRSLVWWGHHMVFSLILEGGHLRRYKENLINRFPSVADREIHLCLSPSPWEWKQGSGYTLELTGRRSSEVAAVLAHRPFFKLARFVPFTDPAVRNDEAHHHAHQTLRAVLPVITE